MSARRPAALAAVAIAIAIAAGTTAAAGPPVAAPERAAHHLAVAIRDQPPPRDGDAMAGARAARAPHGEVALGTDGVASSADPPGTVIARSDGTTTRVGDRPQDPDHGKTWRAGTDEPAALQVLENEPFEIPLGYRVAIRFRIRPAGSTAAGGVRGEAMLAPAALLARARVAAGGQVVIDLAPQPADAGASTTVRGRAARWIAIGSGADGSGQRGLWLKVDDLDASRDAAR